MLFDSLQNWIPPPPHTHKHNTHFLKYSQLCISLAQISNCSQLHLKAPDFPSSFQPHITGWLGLYYSLQIVSLLWAKLSTSPVRHTLFQQLNARVHMAVCALKSIRCNWACTFWAWACTTATQRWQWKKGQLKKVNKMEVNWRLKQLICLLWIWRNQWRSYLNIFSPPMHELQ